MSIERLGLNLHRRNLLGAMGAAAAGALIAGCATTQSVPGLAVSDPAEVTKLHAAFDAMYNNLLKLSPTLCTYLGVDSGDLAYQKSKLDHNTWAERAKYVAFLKAGIASLKAINRSKIQGMDRVNLDTVLWDTENTLFGQTAFKTIGAPYVITQLTGSYQQTPDFLDSMHTIATKADAEAYLARLTEYALVLNEETDAFEADVAMGVIPPDFALKKAIIQLKAQRDAKPEDAVLTKSLARRAKEAKLEGDWGAKAGAIVEGPIKAALSRQIATLEAKLPQAPHDAGVWRLPQGAELYAYGVKNGTSTNMTPDQIHELGLAKVKEISTAIDELLKSQGKSEGTPGERMKAMNTDPKFIYPNTDEGKDKLLADLNKQMGVVFAQLPAYFGVLPKAKCDVKRVPKATELGAPGGYYQSASLDGTRPGAYYINLRDTAETPSWTLPTLTYHEAIPGHHMQISIQQEAKDLPMMRKISGFNAYIEGWALYAEQLADEKMHMYKDDPFGKVGYLHDALFRAVRLVVDTGMHHKKWTREQAVTYMCEQMGDPEASAATEIERYCVWPGQALGYMVGKLKWLELRGKMEAKMGAKYDIRVFHDTGLLAGAVPLAVLEQVYVDAGLI